MSSAPGDGAHSPMFPGVGGGARSRVFPALPPRTDPDAPFASTWWGNAWIAALEDSALDPARLARGRAYAREGHVDTITVEPGRIRAYVHGSRPRPYRAELRMRTLTPTDWDRLLDAAVADPAHLTALLTRDMPQALATTADHTGVPLLPGHGDLVPTCTCPDRGHPCKHAAALTYQTARILDADPFVLLLVRGAEETRVLDELARRNAHFAAREAGVRAGGATYGEAPQAAAAPHEEAVRAAMPPCGGASPSRTPSASAPSDGGGRVGADEGDVGGAADAEAGEAARRVSGTEGVPDRPDRTSGGAGSVAGVDGDAGPVSGSDGGFRAPRSAPGAAARPTPGADDDSPEVRKADRPSDAARKAIRSAARAAEAVRPGAESGDGVQPASVAEGLARPSDAARRAVWGARARGALRPVPDAGAAGPSTSATGDGARPSDTVRKAVRSTKAGSNPRSRQDEADAGPRPTSRPSEAARNAIRRPATADQGAPPARRQQDSPHPLQHPENTSPSVQRNPLPSVQRNPLPSAPSTPLPAEPTTAAPSSPQPDTPAFHPERPAAAPLTPPPIPGTPARDTLTSDYRPPLPPPFPVPPHPGEPPLLPAVPGAPDPTALEFLATDAAARAHAYLRWGESPFAADAWLDAVRLAASHPGLTGRRTFSRQFAELAASVGRTPADLSRAAAAWRQGGEEGLAVLESPWDPPAGPFDRARGALAAADLPRMTIQRNHLTDPTGTHQIRYGHDGRWYPYRAEPHTGPADWWPDGPADDDPVGALTSLLGA